MPQALLYCFARDCLPNWPQHVLTQHILTPINDATAIHGHDIIDMVGTYPDGIRMTHRSNPPPRWHHVIRTA
jgi:hypothetical protein